MAKCYAEGNHIVFDAEDFPQGFKYDISLAAIHDKQGVEVWAKHLSLKRWVTPELLEDFRAVANLALSS